MNKETKERRREVMNKTVDTFIRGEIREGLARLEKSHIHLFKRMYARGDMDKDITDVINEMPQEKLEWALTQVENSLKKRES